MNDTEEYSELYHTFMFGKLRMPRWPFLHIILLMLIGSASLAWSAFNIETPESRKFRRENNIPPPESNGDLMLWPTMLCTFVAFQLYRTSSYRKSVNRIKQAAKDNGIEITSYEVEEVAIKIRTSFIDIFLSIFMLIIMIYLNIAISAHMMDIYIEYFVW